MKTSSNNLAKILGISQRDLNSLIYDISEHSSKDGMIYNYFVNFDSDNNDPKILSKIKGLQDGYYVTLDPWDLYDYGDDLEWQINCSKQLEAFNNEMSSMLGLMSKLGKDIEFSHLVMIHAHIISAFEYFLSSTFIHHVTNSHQLTRKLVETDPAFQDRTIKYSEIYVEYDRIKFRIADYLNKVIFHKIEKVKKLFLSVLSYEFGEVDWLFQAVRIRHDCAHRVGYTQESNKADISVDSIHELIIKCQDLAGNIDRNVN
ncbi:hypothetical protein J7624_07590 [Wohlfahrtiimonas chitiniclastica]|uniref:hypothetical protein n=1 Tax=Wohlfahrtiimonas chitiniclastica TaxID=400946 RepID=UPI001BCBDF5F|nr:hypothetical protein [Wohlfahrtiimonas chitiniclastica]MBS7827007.1 hypothetical protein [Wohlfahrtiimonas chitiniclastica]